MIAPRRLHHYDAIVIGGGLSGLQAAAGLVEGGARVAVLAKGGGYLHFTSGCVDVLGVTPAGERVTDPHRAVEDLTAQHPGHPYSAAGPDGLAAGIDLLRRVTDAAELPFEGDLDRNIDLPTAIGSTRTTCLLPRSMAAGALHREGSILIAGFAGFRDFYPPYIAANLSTAVPWDVHHLYLDLPVLRSRRHLLSLDLARALEDGELRREVARQVRANRSGAARAGFPAVLGLKRSADLVRDLEDAIGIPIFEISTLPPSVPGMRIQQAFRTWLQRRGVRVEVGFWVDGRIEGRRATEVSVHSAGHLTTYSADAFVLATGGTGGGGIAASRDGTLHETVFGLPVEGPEDRAAWARPRFVSARPQPVSLAGVRANERLQPLTPAGEPVENLFVTASNLSSWDPTREKSGEGVALATGWKAASEALTVMGARAPQSLAR